MDADAGQHKRNIVAFIGGLDLCLGRYDTPAHSLFRTLQTTHKDDFHNPNFVVSYPFFIFIVCPHLISGGLSSPYKPGFVGFCYWLSKTTMA